MLTRICVSFEGTVGWCQIHSQCTRDHYIEGSPALGVVKRKGVWKWAVECFLVGTLQRSWKVQFSSMRDLSNLTEPQLRALKARALRKLARVRAESVDLENQYKRIKSFMRIFKQMHQEVGQREAVTPNQCNTSVSHHFIYSTFVLPHGYWSLSSKVWCMLTNAMLGTVKWLTPLMFIWYFTIDLSVCLDHFHLWFLRVPPISLLLT